MFDIGFSELVVIAVIALIVLGPERMPEAARALGTWVAKARRFMRTMSEELERETDFQGFRDLKDEFDNSRRKFEEEWNRTTEAGKESKQDYDYEAETAAPETENEDAGESGPVADHNGVDADAATNGSGAGHSDGATDGAAAEPQPKPKPKPRTARKPAASASRPRAKTAKPRTTKPGTAKPKTAKPTTTKPKAAKPKTAKAAESKTAREKKPKQTRKSAAGRTNTAPDQPDIHETVARERERNA